MGNEGTMSNRWSGYVALGAMGLMSACQVFAPAAIQQAATVRLQGSAFVPAKQIVVGYRTQASLVEKPAVGAVVRLYTRDSQSLTGLTDAKVDGAGNFAFQQEVPEGLYLVVATLGSTRLMAFVRLKAGIPGTTVLSAASTMVANRLGRTKLKLTGLQQAEFDEIAAQARNLMEDADVPDLTPDGVSAATDAFLASRQVIKSRIEALLSRLASMEGLGNDPTATLPVTATPGPGASPAPTVAPDPVYTPVPTPAPTTLDLSQATTLKVMSERQTDSTPYWVEMDGSQFLWVSCPASNSIMRFDRARPEWSYSRPTTNLLRDRFIPGQLAVDESVPSAPVIWVGNQRSDGTRVARYDQWGNFLGSVEAGPAPSVVSMDTDSAGRKVWIGVTGDDSGKILVADKDGRQVSVGQLKGRPFRLHGVKQDINGALVDLMWMATPQAFYGAPVNVTREPTMTLAPSEVNLSSLPGEIRAFTVDPGGRVFVVKQAAGHSLGVMAEINPQTLAIVQSWNFPTSARVVGVLSDSLSRLWVTTASEMVRFSGSNYQVFNGLRPFLGLFAGRDYTFWSIHEGSPQLLKRSYGE